MRILITGMAVGAFCVLLGQIHAYLTSSESSRKSIKSMILGSATIFVVLLILSLWLNAH